MRPAWVHARTFAFRSVSRIWPFPNNIQHSLMTEEKVYLRESQANERLGTTKTPHASELIPNLGTFGFHAAEDGATSVQRLVL